MSQVEGFFFFGQLFFFFLTLSKKFCEKREVKWFINLFY